MSTKKKPEPMRRGWVRVSNRWPAKVQIAALEKHGIGAAKTYGLGKGESIADMTDGLVSGDHLYVYGTHRLATSRREYEWVFDRLRRKSIVIHDIYRDEIVTAREMTAAAFVAGDLAEIAGEARMDAAGLSRRAGKRMGKAEAVKVWLDPSIPTNDEAAERTGWNSRTLRRWAEETGIAGGASGRKPGPKRKK